MERYLAGMLLLAFTALAGCQGGVAERPEPAPRDSLAAGCRNDEVGYRVSYPQGWHTNAGHTAAPCSMFDPRPFTVSGDGEDIPLEVAVAVFRNSASFQQVASGFRGKRVVSRQPLKVAGRQALRIETQNSGEWGPEGLRSYRYVIDIGEGTLLVSTFAVGLLDFETKKAVLDRIVESMEFSGPHAVSRR